MAIKKIKILSRFFGEKLVFVGHVKCLIHGGNELCFLEKNWYFWSPKISHTWGKWKKSEVHSVKKRHHPKSICIWGVCQKWIFSKNVKIWNRQKKRRIYVYPMVIFFFINMIKNKSPEKVSTNLKNENDGWTDGWMDGYRTVWFL